MPAHAGRSKRWKIENETFNTLKNQGDHFEHNFGHGKQYLSTVLKHLMMLAFLIDQIQQRCCRLFEAALTAAKSKTRLWRKLRNRFDLCLIQSREVLYRSILHPPQIPLWLDTS
ncbi:transposase (fragment) [Thiocapsa sp. KS1]